MSYRLGVDVGGTFTDLLLFNEDSGEFWRTKTPSTPHDSSEGILNGVTDICKDAGVGAADIVDGDDMLVPQLGDNFALVHKAFAEPAVGGDQRG